eukprot:3007120-Lingulodinium_polyedra.AAC.1
MRLWAVCRRPAVEGWKAANDRPYLACGSERWPCDVVWRCAVRAEASLSGHRGQAATQLWDMHKSHEQFVLA